MNAWVRTVVASACFAAMGLLAPAAYSQDVQSQWADGPNLVVNGDFSANGGSLEGWSYNTNPDNLYWQFTPYGTANDASNGCGGAACITGATAEQNYLYQTIRTVPFIAIYKLTFTYDAGTGGVNELKVLAGRQVVDDIVNVAQGSNTYTAYFIADRFDTKLNFLGRQDNGFSFLTGISVTIAHHHRDWDSHDDQK
jgi:hypothetical protein